jgi:hypothetical protein
MTHITQLFTRTSILWRVNQEEEQELGALGRRVAQLLPVRVVVVLLSLLLRLVLVLVGSVTCCQPCHRTHHLDPHFLDLNEIL